MNKCSRILTWILGILSVAMPGITLINFICDESCQLLAYDLKNKFADNRVYVVLLCILLFIMLGGSIVYWQILCGSVHGVRGLKIKKKLFGTVLKQRALNLKLILDVTCIIVIAICLYINSSHFFRDIPQGTWEQTKTIGHSFGVVNDDDYTGSLEAFEYNYALGRRTMEVDLILTTDDQLVLKHDWDTPAQEGISESVPPDKDTFLSTKLLGRYTPLSFAQLCEMMKTYPDIWIVTDTKSTENEEIRKQFEVMVATVRQLNCEEILDRIIVQVYNEEMYEIVDNIYGFPNYIFTMYWRFYNDDWLGITRDVCRFCVNNGIETIAIGTNRISPEMKAIADHYERNVYIHTVNDMEEADKYFGMGVNGIYTDIITDRDLVNK